MRSPPESIAELCTGPSLPTARWTVRVPASSWTNRLPGHQADDIDQAAAAAAEYKQLPAHRMALHRLLHHQRQTGRAFVHVCIARRQPDLHANKNRHYCRPNTQSGMRPIASVSMSLSARTRRPRPNSIVTSQRFRRNCGGSRRF